MHVLRICLLLFVLLATASAQNLSEIYRSGTVRLDVDPEFAAGVEWGNIFSDFDATNRGSAIGARKSLAVAGDGSVFVGNYSSYNIAKFDSRGRFVKTFGEEGNSPGQFRNRPTLGGVLDNRYVFTSEYNGRLTFFDLNGNFTKLIQLDYMPLSCVPLRNNKIGVLGHVPYGDSRVRNIVAVVDINTEDEVIIFSEFEDHSDDCVIIEKDDQSFHISHRLTMIQRFLRTAGPGNLVVAKNQSPEIDIYTPEGVLQHQVSLEVDRVDFKQQDKDDYRQSTRASLDRLEITHGEVQNAVEQMTFPDKLPYLYELKVDSDDNLLVFTYTEADIDRQFQAYTYGPTGGFICKTTLILDDFDLNLSPKFNTVQFHNQYVYAIATAKDNPNGPPRLIRGRLTAK